MKFQLWNKKIFLILGVIIFFLVIFILSNWFEDSYVKPRLQPFEVRVENIEKIFYHENFRFTYLVRKDNAIVPVRITDTWEEESKLTFYEDVPPGKLMWADIKGRGGSKDGVVTDIKIHLHSIKDVEGGSWNHGKFGSGNTTVVE